MHKFLFHINDYKLFFCKECPQTHHIQSHYTTLITFIFLDSSIFVTKIHFFKTTYLHIIGSFLFEDLTLFFGCWVGIFIFAEVLKLKRKKEQFFFFSNMLFCYINYWVSLLFPNWVYTFILFTLSLSFFSFASNCFLNLFKFSQVEAAEKK
jgi:hypothetical protein